MNDGLLSILESLAHDTTIAILVIRWFVAINKLLLLLHWASRCAPARQLLHIGQKCVELEELLHQLVHLHSDRRSWHYIQNPAQSRNGSSTICPIGLCSSCVRHSVWTPYFASQTPHPARPQTASACRLGRRSIASVCSSITFGLVITIVVFTT